MWKQRLKPAAARLGQRLGVWALLDRAHRHSWTVVCYHRVLPADDREQYFCPDLVVTPEALRAHCAIYCDHFEVLTVAEGWRRCQRGEFGARPRLSLSFDDGYQDNFALAAPILEHYGLRGSFYVIAGLVDTAERPWYDRVAASLIAQLAPVAVREQIEILKALPDAERRARVEAVVAQAEAPDMPAGHDLIMSAAQLKVLQQRGHEIGAHSTTHPILTRVNASLLGEETDGARKRLELALGTPVSGYCYPNGDYNESVVQSVEKAGYEYALSTRQGLNRRDASAMEIRRVFIQQDWLSSGGVPETALLRAELALLHRWRRS